VTETDPRPVTLSLAREEAWAVHAALVAHLERGWEDDREPRFAVDRPSFAEQLLRQVEASDGTLHLDPSALTYLRDRLEAHLDRGPARDRPHLRSALDAVEAALQSASPSSTTR
jgi:hypothetical protein